MTQGLLSGFRTQVSESVFMQRNNTEAHLTENMVMILKPSEIYCVDWQERILVFGKRASCYICYKLTQQFINKKTTAAAKWWFMAVCCFRTWMTCGNRWNYEFYSLANYPEGGYSAISLMLWSLSTLGLQNTSLSLRWRSWVASRLPSDALGSVHSSKPSDVQRRVGQNSPTAMWNTHWQ